MATTQPAPAGELQNCAAPCPPCPSCPALPACPPTICPNPPPCVVIVVPEQQKQPPTTPYGGFLPAGAAVPSTSPPAPVTAVTHQVCCECQACPEPPPCVPAACPGAQPWNPVVAKGPTAGAGTGLSTRDVDGIIDGVSGLFLLLVTLFSYFRWCRKPHRARRQRRAAAGDVEMAPPPSPSTAASSSSSSSSGSEGCDCDCDCA